MSPPDDLDLSGWLWPDEQVRWHGRPARASVPWLQVVGLVAGSLIAGGILTETEYGSRGSGVFLVFLVVIVVLNVANAIGMVRRARTAAVRNRYVLTDRRASVFRAPGQLVAEVRADGPEFRAKRAGMAGWGEIDWGESHYEEPTGRRAIIMRMNPLQYSANEGRVVFAELADFDAAYNAAVAVRQALGAPTSNPVGPKVRGDAPVALGALDSPAAGVLNVAALSVGVFVLGCIVLLLGWTLLGPVENFMPWPAAVLFVFIFPLFFWAIAISIGRSQRAGERLELTGPRMRRRQLNRGGIPLPLKFLPRWATGVMVAVFVLCWISGMLVFASNDLPGQPSYNPTTSTYSANNHGSVIPLSKAKYDQAVRAQDRLFLSVELAFVVVAVGAASDELIRRRRSPYLHRPGLA